MTFSFPHHDREVRLGTVYGLSAYMIWGFSVIYWKWLFDAGALEVLSHRVIWASVMIGAVLAARNRMGAVLAMVSNPRTFLILLITGTLLAVNWSIFVWAVLTDQILQASLGYYINPLVSMVLGYFLLGERLSRFQGVAVALATLGVIGMLILTGSLPWPALMLAVTFAVYGYLRKVTKVVALDALFVEMLLFVPVAFGVLYWLSQSGDTIFGPSNPLFSLLLIGGGLVTLLPLAFFGESVGRIKLTTMGFLQYVAPSMQFLLAVFFYGEPFETGQIFVFGCIWVGLGVYSADALAKEHQVRRKS
jgi:chloramphenicol-sensitive protein RarD